MYNFRIKTWQKVEKPLIDALITCMNRKRDDERTLADNDTIVTIIQCTRDMGWLKPKTSLHDGRVSWEGSRKELKIYREAFEGKFLDATEAFYAKKAATWIITNNVSEYIKHVNDSLDLEKEYGKNFLEDTTTKLSIDRIVD